LQGRLDIPLSTTGEDQIRSAGKWIARAMRPPAPVALWSSPIERARQSAQLLAESLVEEGWAPLPVQLHEGLCEIDEGAFSGRSIPSLSEEPIWQSYIAHPYATRFPGGESVPEVQARAHAAVMEILSQAAATVLLVSHGGIIRAFVAALLSLPETIFHSVRFSNGSLTHLRCLPTGFRLLSLNVAAHAGE